MNRFLSNHILKNNKKHLASAAFLGLAVFLCCALFFSWRAGLIFAALFVILGVIKIETKSPKPAILLNLLWAFACVTVLVFVSPLVGFLALDLQKILLNYLCVFFVIGLLFLMSARFRMSVNLAVIALIILSVVNTVVYQLRGKELGIQDFLSVGTALSVAQQYKIQISFWTAYFCCICGVCLFAQFSISKFPEANFSRKRLLGLAMLAVAGFALHLGSNDVAIQTWSVEGSRQNGYYLNFYLGIRTSHVEKPVNYSENLTEISAGRQDIEEGISTDNLPNIVVIMDESFVDFRIFDNPPETNIPVTPFLDSLSDNAVRGYAVSPAFGGNTVNVEFEFLTGHSMAFLPENAVPYQQ